MSKSFDQTKPFQRGDGRPARLVGEINHPDYPLVVAIDYNGIEVVSVYTRDGNFNKEGILLNHDLVNITEKRTVWVNVYWDKDNFYSLTHTSHEAAVKDATLNNTRGNYVVATAVPIEVTLP